MEDSVTAPSIANLTTIGSSHSSSSRGEFDPSSVTVDGKISAQLLYAAFALTSLYETMMNLSQLIRVLRRGRGRWGNTSELRMNWETSSLRGFGAEDHDGNSLNSSSHYTSNQMLFYIHCTV